MSGHAQTDEGGVNAYKNGAQILLALAEKAERDGWSGPADLSTNHNSYFVQIWNEQEATKHPKI